MRLIVDRGRRSAVVEVQTISVVNSTRRQREATRNAYRGVPRLCFNKSAYVDVEEKRDRVPAAISRSEK